LKEILYNILRKNRTLLEENHLNMALNDEILKLINQRENESLEFKSSARWDYKQSKKNKELEFVILKTVSALMNSKGGTLLIGIDDDGNIIGLKPDYKTLQKLNADGYEVFLHNLFSQNFGSDAGQFIDIKITEIDGEDVCKITVPASVKPIYLDNKLFIRTGASSRELTTKEAIDYYLVRWQGNISEEQINQEKFAVEIKSAEDKISEKLESKLNEAGYWLIYAHPAKFIEKRINDPNIIRKIVDQAMVKKREDFFPNIRDHFFKPQHENFNKGIKYYDIKNDKIEAGWFYQSGLFVWKRAIQEDINELYKRYLIDGYNINLKENPSFIDFRNIIIPVTEFFQFFRDFYSQVVIEPEEEIYLKIILTKSNQRLLTPYTQYRVQGLSTEDTIEFDGQYKLNDLKENYLEIARKDFIKNFLRLFNTNYPEERLKERQDNFILYGDVE
jgi:hypothetical protein